MAPSLHFIKPTFAGGEYAPSMYARVDVSRYTNGARKLLNFIVHSHGGASNRPGWHFVARAKYSDRAFRLHDFQFSSTQTYVLEFGHQYIRFYTNGGQIIVSSASAWLTTTPYVIGNYVTQGGIIYYCIVAHTSGTFNTDLAAGKWTAQTVYEIPSPYSESDLDELNFTQSADVLFMFHPNFQTRQLNRFGNTNWTITLYDFLYGPYQVPNSNTSLTITPSGLTGSVTLTASSALFNALQVGGLFNINQNVPESSVNSSLGSVTAGSSITCGGTWRIITHGTWAGTIAVQKSTDGGSTWANIRSFSSASDFNANTFGTEDMSNNAPNFLVRLNMSAYTSGTCSYTLTADAFRNVGHVKITAYTDTTHVTVTVTKSLGLTTATSDWAEGSWSDYRGWPSVGEFNQDRLVTANTATEPQTIWQSKSSNYYDYSRSSPLVDSDGITTNIPSRQLNGVNGFVPLLGLIALTSSSEWGIGSTDTVMSPLTITQKPYGFDGSIGLKPVIIKNRAVYVQFMGSIILDLGYELVSNSFTGANLSILANHLFEGYNITDMCYQQYPDSIVWAVRNDGMLLSMTYLREQEVIAWAHHETEGLVETICSIPASGYNQVWLGTQRGDDKFIEYMDHRMSSTLPEDQFFVDCGISYDGSLPDSYVKLYLACDGVNDSAIFIDGETSPKTVTSVGALISTEASKFGGTSGKFPGDAGLDSYTKLLLHCDGSDASTTFTDSETTPKTVTANGNTMISTTLSKFGGASGYFNTGIDSSTVLMLHCDGTNGGTTFTDSASGAKTVTAHGDVQTSTAQKKFGTASVLFDGTGDYLTLADSTDWSFGTGDFTIDFWINPTALGGFPISQYDGSATSWYLSSDVSGNLQYIDYVGGVNQASYITTSPILVVGLWQHVALVRNGSNFYIFVNGVSQTLTVATAIGTNDLGNAACALGIGATQTGVQCINGYMDEIRVSKGIARWTTNFQVPLTPYSSGDYLTLADSADWDLSTGDFTIDFWFNLSAKHVTFFSQVTDNNNYFLMRQNDGVWVFFVVVAGVGIIDYEVTISALTPFTWHHFALVRYGSVLRFFVDGVQIGSDGVAATMPDLTGVFNIGKDASVNTNPYFNGFMDEFRLSKGIARWTTTFTPPMAAYSSPGYLTLADSADWNLGTGDFTIDFWVNFINTSATQYFCEQGADANNRFYFNLDSGVLKFFDNVASTTKASYSVSWAPVAGTWYHLALVRSTSTVYLFINGISQTLTVSTAISTNDLGDQTGLFTIGRSVVNTSFYLNGYLDEFKFAKGVARWTANFTPPTVPGFQLSSNVITGLDHLEGNVVSILADGAVSPQQTVANGQITLPSLATKVHIGLPYTSDLETLNIENGLADGTMQGRKLRISKVTMRVLNSKSGYIGPDEDHLKPIKSVFADYRSSTSLYTGDLKHSLTGGYADGGRMFIRQTDPLPITVLALMPLVNVAGTNMESA